MGFKSGEFKAGNTHRWRVTWPTDIAGAVIKFRLAHSSTQDTSDLEIVGILDDPDVEGQVYGATLEISAVQSLGLVGRFECEHEITLANGDVDTFYPEDRHQVTFTQKLPPAVV